MQYGLAFEFTPSVEGQLRSAGATDDVLRVLRALTVVLVLETSPGGAQVYIDDEPVGTTSLVGRLRLSSLTAGAHRIRVSREGYRRYESTVLVTPSLKNLAVKLEPVPATETGVGRG